MSTRRAKKGEEEKRGPQTRHSYPARPRKKGIGRGKAEQG